MIIIILMLVQIVFIAWVAYDMGYMKGVADTVNSREPIEVEKQFSITDRAIELADNNLVQHASVSDEDLDRMFRSIMLASVEGRYAGEKLLMWMAWPPMKSIWR